jgi:adenylate kinase
MGGNVRIVLLGPPGSGKGTQGRLLGSRLGIPVFGMGDLLRGEIRKGTDIGLSIEPVLASGNFPPNDLVMDVLFNHLEGCDSFILDGFPRDDAQAEALDTMLADKGTGISYMISLIVPEGELRKRLIIRGKETGRTDDNEETITKRIKEYIEKTTPVAGYYESKGKLNSIEGVGSVEDIFSRICSVLNEQGGN